ncbi:hypothetical protein ASG76_10410 [Nocardioides sp. Soil774]|uniref:helix-turn-helix domain-containing protein n=1 Tax=Nocardioides sp. Soil774 TaxID=1736408 RepID=UPI0006F8EA1B|nr:helix-turn-helix transcriptional regulator [Nocardioides sp. Soil774]KRE94793.1 hypothetical protein ASG76_10410 [Nocardioides sp. Soil774]
MDDIDAATWDSMANWTEAEREWWWMGPFKGHVPGIVRRVRRILDVSQRGLAEILGVSQSQVARWETARTSPRVAMVLRLLELAGVEVRLTDRDTGAEVAPMREDGARKHGGSRYPAHTDLKAAHWWIPRRLRSMTSVEAYDARDRSRRRRDPGIRFTLSPHRKGIERWLHGTPDDHPAVHQLAAEVEWCDEQRERRRAGR